MATNDDDLYPIALLIDELKNDDNAVRTKSIGRLKTIASALGPERTRNELIPFLNDSTEDEDEILVIMAEQLGGFVDLVGGPEHAACLLKPLEHLACVEETVVREKATESICICISVLDDVSETVCPVIDRLTNGDWFTSKISACSLFAAAYPKVKDAEKKSDLRRLYTALCGDDTPMVRRAAAKNLGAFAAVQEKEFLLTDTLNLFKALASDDQDSVRLLAIENCTAFGKLLTEAENNDHVLPIVRASVEDRSWRVRFNVAKEFYPLSAAMGDSITLGHLLPNFSNLLQDAEAEVRAAATKNITGYREIIKNETFVQEVIPTMQILAQDTVQNVRVALATACMDLAPELGEEITLTHIVPLLHVFLTDEAPEVRLNVLQKLHLLAPWMQQLTQSLLPAIVNLARDSQWRVRAAIVTAIPVFATNLGAAYFQSNLLSIYINAFSDAVCDVRMQCCEALTLMLESPEIGAEWLQANLIPNLQEMWNESTLYLQRNTILNAVKALLTDKAGVLIPDLTDLLVKGLEDNTPNVKFIASVAVCKSVSVIDASILASRIRPILDKHLQHEDIDVREYAQAAVQAIDKAGAA